MYQLTKNNYYQNPKNSTIYTPPEVSEFIFKLISPHIWDWQSTYNMSSHILDPCSGTGNLLAPWQKPASRWDESYPTVGIDKDLNSSADWITDFLSLTETDFYQKFKRPVLVLCNPPFNGSYPKLAPEIWLDKIIELFGKDIPLVLFVPAGFTLNLTLESKRYHKFANNTYPPIVSRITLPKNIFSGVKFHSEILIFNIPNLQPHYFYNNQHHEQ